MKIKRFRAPTVPAAIEAVRRELGRDAIILDTKRVRAGGLAGFFGPRLVEVTAAADPGVPGLRHGGRLLPLISEPAPGALHGERAQQPEERAQQPSEGIALRLNVPGPPETARPEPWIERFLAGGLPLEVAERLGRGLPPAPGRESEIRVLLGERLKALLGRPRPVIVGPQCRVVALMGQTGVGKTTTIAKLAARFHLRKGKRVALVTADTYRIAAIDQLQSYAGIIGVPMEVVYNQHDVRRLLGRFSDFDLILVDTPGRNPRDGRAMSDLKRLLAAIGPHQVHLLMPAGTDLGQAREMAHAYSRVGYDRLLFTKLDEGLVPGLIPTLAAETGKPLSYLATGQQVPEDLAVATASQVTGYLWDALGAGLDKRPAAARVQGGAR